MMRPVQTIRVGLIGSAGRMGTALHEHLRDAPDIAVHCQLEQGESIEQFIALRPDVVVDLSVGRAVDAQGVAIVNAGLPYIVGATGYKPETVDHLRAAAETSGSPVLIVPNFSLGANLMIRFAESAARLMRAPVITERHHAGKADAPSGTARYTALRIGGAMSAQAQPEQAPSQSASAYNESLPGVLGGAEHGVPLHSIRGEGYLAEQEVRFCLPGEALLIEHRSIDRRCFMPGIVYAIRNIGKVRGLQIGLDTILDV
jgi:4-hydroxy-tetrahydrodipicolinate reductase